MHNFFRRHTKKLMALFGVVLMIAFIMPAGMRNGAGSGEAVAGHIGKDKIMRADVSTAEAGWALLNSRVRVRSGQGETEQWVPVGRILPTPDADTFSRSPVSYFLLMDEARRLGILPDQEDARRLLNDEHVAIQMPDGSRIGYANVSDQDLKDQLLVSMTGLGMVQKAFARAADAVKISQPLVNSEAMGNFQTVKTYLMEFSAKVLREHTGDPTPQQLSEQFNKFADVEPTENTSEQNPFGFGYKFPNRVKLQFVSVPVAAAQEAIKTSKSAYDWQVDAYKYYDAHAAEFPTTSSSDMNLVTTAPSSTTKPFDQAQQDILDKLQSPLAARLQRQVLADINSRLQDDFRNKGTSATSAPTTGPGDYASLDYLNNLAAQIKTKYKVEVVIGASGDKPMSAAELRMVPGIAGVPAIPDFATNSVDPFLSEDKRGQPGSMALLQPSKPMGDEFGTSFIYRVTAADPAHKPASLDEVRDQVLADWKRVTAFDAAKQQAQKAFDLASKVGVQEASKQLKLNMIATNFYPRSSKATIDNFPLSARAQSAFVDKTFALLGKINDTKGGKPVALVEMPADDKLAVAELVAAESRVPPEQQSYLAMYISNQTRRKYDMLMAQQWFDPEAIAERTKFVDDTKAPKKPA